MDLLRFITAGSVDDGKSTLIGRLLYDSKSILVDQFETLKKQSKNAVHSEIDLALLTDGLRAEREQGITIDVAYKYFSTPKRKFIIADAPGHIQYTRNMITGASNADCIVILVDARNGVVEQTKRHSIIASLLQIPHVIVAINKMDMVDYDKVVYDVIVEQYKALAKQLNLQDVYYIPMSALKGDNIITTSPEFPWYKGEPLLSYLENLEVTHGATDAPARFQVQYVIRPQSEDLHDYRGYAGRISNGSYAVDDVVRILPEGLTSSISAIEAAGKEVKEAYAGQSVILHLKDDIDISRGDAFVKEHELPKFEQEFDAFVCWMDAKELHEGAKYLLQKGSRRVKAVVKEIEYKLDVNTLEQHPSPQSAKLNDVVKVRIKTAEPLSYDAYTKLSSNGTAILIDQTSNMTSGALLLQ
ncbi:sulfate adenylyltransferase subunit 1 [Flavisolibacter ginsenosidimutans]|uniref:sulfate adenylyltransferase n=1 Tax=Flavisolibacter ginsenosidimutans TaxID=661481 RepID=A0A5B8UI95_9BACT|nr:GTP-binding protein [Flavisolibacter ginsenosidimutans]QEC55899.1 sulfate adenylyltransferase [Flavisolibacter ginsenosidimutans]